MPTALIYLQQIILLMVLKKISCSICGDMFLKKCETRHFKRKYVLHSDKKLAWNLSTTSAIKVLWKTQDFVIKWKIILVKNITFSICLLPFEIIECPKSQIHTISSLLKNLLYQWWNRINSVNPILFGVRSALKEN